MGLSSSIMTEKAQKSIIAVVYTVWLTVFAIFNKLSLVEALLMVLFGQDIY